ncbi:hypothetical protein D3C76_677880 [compost metagenome]
MATQYPLVKSLSVCHLNKTSQLLDKSQGSGLFLLYNNRAYSNPLIIINSVSPETVGIRPLSNLT